MDKSRTRLFKAEISTHEDERRSILDLALPPEVNFPIRQAKTIKYFKKGAIVGNHYHPIDSQRTEVYIAVGPPQTDLFKFLYREDGNIKEAILRRGDGCFIPPGVTHTFEILSDEAAFFGFSNLSVYNPEDEVKDILI